MDLTAASSSDEGAADAATEAPVTPVVHGPAAGAGCAHSAGVHAKTPIFSRVRLEKVSKSRKGSCARVDAAQLPQPVPQGLGGCSKQLPAVVRGPPAATVPVEPRALSGPSDEPIKPVKFKRLRLHSEHAATLTALVVEGAAFDVGVRLPPAQAQRPLERDGDILWLVGDEQGPRGRADRTAPVRLTQDGEALGDRAWDRPSDSRSNGEQDLADVEMEEAVSGEHERSRRTEDVSLGASDPCDRGENFGKGNEYNGPFALDSE